MDSFNPFSTPSQSSTPTSSTDIKQQLMHQLRQEASLQQAKALIEKVNSHCFTACVPSPGPSLSGKEEKCYTQCMEKYIQAWNVVSRSYIGKLQKERESMGIGGQGGGGTFL